MNTATTSNAKRAHVLRSMCRRLPLRPFDGLFPKLAQQPTGPEFVAAIELRLDANVLDGSEFAPPFDVGYDESE